MVTAIEFTMYCEDYIKDIEQVIKRQYIPAIQKLKDSDPQSLVSPNQVFKNEEEAKGFVWKLFMKEVEKWHGRNNTLESHI